MVKRQNYLSVDFSMAFWAFTRRSLWLGGDHLDLWQESSTMQSAMPWAWWAGVGAPVLIPRGYLVQDPSLPQARLTLGGASLWVPLLKLRLSFPVEQTAVWRADNTYAGSQSS